MFVELTSKRNGKRMTFAVEHIVMIEEVARASSGADADYHTIVHCTDGSGYIVDATFDEVDKQLVAVLGRPPEAMVLHASV